MWNPFQQIMLLFIYAVISQGLFQGFLNRKMFHLSKNKNKSDVAKKTRNVQIYNKAKLPIFYYTIKTIKHLHYRHFSLQLIIKLWENCKFVVVFGCKCKTVGRKQLFKFHYEKKYNHINWWHKEIWRLKWYYILLDIEAWCT